MKRKIAWELWQLEEIKEVQEDSENFHEDLDEEEIVGVGQFMMFDPSLGFPTPKIKTPMGSYDIDDPLSPNKMFECWIGHTNFRITQTDYSTMDSINGLGCMKVISPNRFFVGIEKLFDFQTLRLEIENLLCKDDEKQETLSETLNRLCSSKQKWAVFVTNEGEIKTITDQEDGYQKKLNAFKKMKNGNIITCDDV